MTGVVQPGRLGVADVDGHPQLLGVAVADRPGDVALQHAQLEGGQVDPDEVVAEVVGEPAPALQVEGQRPAERGEVGVEGVGRGGVQDAVGRQALGGLEAAQRGGQRVVEDVGVGAAPGVERVGGEVAPGRQPVAQVGHADRPLAGRQVGARRGRARGRPGARPRRARRRRYPSCGGRSASQRPDRRPGRRTGGRPGRARRTRRRTSRGRSGTTSGGRAGAGRRGGPGARRRSASSPSVIARSSAASRAGRGSASVSRASPSSASHSRSASASARRSAGSASAWTSAAETPSAGAASRTVASAAWARASAQSRARLGVERGRGGWSRAADVRTRDGDGLGERVGRGRRDLVRRRTGRRRSPTRAG